MYETTTGAKVNYAKSNVVNLNNFVDIQGFKKLQVTENVRYLGFEFDVNGLSSSLTLEKVMTVTKSIFGTLMKRNISIISKIKVLNVCIVPR